jgi:hypothetical protein
MTAAPARARIALRLSRVKTTYATGSGSLRDGHATVQLRARRALLRTRYTVGIVLTSPQAPRGVIMQAIGVRLG